MTSVKEPELMMEKVITLMLWVAFLCSSVTVRAQNAPYVGLGLNASTAHLATFTSAPAYDSYWFGRILTQVGAAVSSGFELRLSLDQGLTGPDVVWHWDYKVSDMVLGGEIYVGAHGTFGAEYQTAGFGTFLELRPMIIDSFRENFPLVDLRLGVNLYF